MKLVTKFPENGVFGNYDPLFRLELPANARQGAKLPARIPGLKVPIAVIAEA